MLKTEIFHGIAPHVHCPQVIKETLRLGNIIEFSYREAVEDVDFEGSYTCNTPRKIQLISIRKSRLTILHR